MEIREAHLSDERQTELMGLQSELAGTALKAVMEKDQASGPEAAAAAGQRHVRRTVRVHPLAWMAVSFLAGAVAGALLRPVTVRRGREAR